MSKGTVAFAQRPSLRIAIPVGCLGISIVAIFVSDTRSITSTAPASLPTDSCVTNAYRESGLNAIPCGIFFVVGMRATSLNVFASRMLTLCCFLFVTTTSAPFGDGSTLYAPIPVVVPVNTLVTVHCWTR